MTTYSIDQAEALWWRMGINVNGEFKYRHQAKCKIELRVKPLGDSTV